MDIRGLTVHEVLIEAASEIGAEYYTSVVFDRSAKAPLILLSTKGGMDIEQVAEDDPGAIASLHVDPMLGFQEFHGRRLAFEAGIDADLVRPVSVMLAKLYDAFVSEDAMLVEINPLIVTPERELRALDAKVTLDDSALYRHPDSAAFRNLSAEDPRGSSAERLRNAALSGWRYRALSSSVTFASSARSSRSGVTISGLISTSIASSDTKAS